MLMAAMRLNIPAIFVSGGPMEAGKTKLSDQLIRLDLVDAMIEAADPNVSDERIDAIERSACPTCGSCSGMFTANSMNCLTEALGLSLPGNGSMLATHADRKELFLKAGRQIVELCKRYYEQDDESVLPRSIGTFEAFENARMKFDVRYYLVAILFILFDLEVAFMLPWAVVFKDLGAYGFWSMLVFIVVLTVGFVYEWKKGALEWE